VNDRHGLGRDLSRQLRDLGAIDAPGLQSPAPFAGASGLEPPAFAGPDGLPRSRRDLPRWPLWTALTVVFVAAMALPLAVGVAFVRASGVPTLGPGGPEQSANWAGYVVSGGPFTSVSATWRVPDIRPGTQPTEVAAMWVGLDGRGTSTLEQIGTISGMLGGTRYYAAWFEMVPSPPVYLTMDLKPGDRITASVTTGGDGLYRLTIVNRTNHERYTTVEHSTGAEPVTAEVVVEAPGTIGGLAPLPDFGIAGFREATVDGRPIGTFRWHRLIMAAGSRVQAETSPLARDAASFSVTWRNE